VSGITSLLLPKLGQDAYEGDQLPEQLGVAQRDDEHAPRRMVRWKASMSPVRWRSLSPRRAFLSRHSSSRTSVVALLPSSTAGLPFTPALIASSQLRYPPMPTPAWAPTPGLTRGGFLRAAVDRDPSPTSWLAQPRGSCACRVRHQPPLVTTHVRSAMGAGPASLQRQARGPTSSVSEPRTGVKRRARGPATWPRRHAPRPSCQRRGACVGQTGLSTIGVL
jgi:hypothetical protein